MISVSFQFVDSRAAQLAIALIHALELAEGNDDYEVDSLSLELLPNALGLIRDFVNDLDEEARLLQFSDQGWRVITEMLGVENPYKKPNSPASPIQDHSL